MRSVVVWVVSVTLFLAVAPLASADRARADALSTLAALQAAGLRRDVAVLERLYAPDYFHTNADGSVMRREDVLASYRAAPTMTFSAADTSEQRLVVRDGLAVVSERVALHGKTHDGNPFISSYRVTYVLEKRGPVWRVVNSHASLLGIDKNPGAGR